MPFPTPPFTRRLLSFQPMKSYHQRSGTTANFGRIFATQLEQLMAAISQLPLLHTSVQTTATAKGFFHRTLCLFATSTYSSSIHSLDGKDQPQMHVFTMMQHQEICTSHLAGTFSPMLVILCAHSFLYHTVVFGTTLLSGLVHVKGISTFVFLRFLMCS